jgi:hypothetical protein
MKIFTLLFTFMPLFALAQLYVDGRIKPGNVYQHHRMITKRGDVFQGKLRDYSNGKIAFKATDIGLLEFDFSEVDSIGLSANRDKDDFSFDHSERCMFMPTAFSLKMGQLEYVNRGLIANSINYGIRNNFTAGVGVMPFPDGTASWVNLKCSKQLNNWMQVAAGSVLSLGVYNPYPDFEGFETDYRLIAPYGVVTLGNKSLFVNFVASKAWSYQYNDPEVTKWMYGLSGAARLAKRLQVYAEKGKSFATIYNDDYLSAGFAILSERRSFTFGFMRLEKYTVIPTFGFSGKRIVKKYR